MLALSMEGRWRDDPAPLIFFNLLVCLFFNNAVLGQTVQKLPLKELTLRADVILRAKVQKVSSQQATDPYNIATHIEVNVVEQWKGPKVSSLVLSEPGGSMGGTTQAVPGIPHFVPGEEVMLFLKQTEKGNFQPLGGSQGKFVVKTDPQSKKEFIQDLTGRTQNLDDFLIQLRAALK